MAMFLAVMRGATLALAALALVAQSPLAPEVTEGRLRNGIRVLLVERPGLGMVRAGLYFRGGSADTGGLPPVAAPLLVRSLFARLDPEDLGEQPELDGLLQQEDNLREALRIEELRRGRSARAEGGAEDDLSLHASHQQALDRINGLTTRPDRPDLLDPLGAVRRETLAEPDALVYGLDLPAAAFAEWAGLEARRLRSLRLARLPRIRRDLDAAAGKSGFPESLLLESALPGQPYCRVLEPGGQAGVLLSDLKAYARTALAPGRLAIVLAGDLKARESLPVLESTFGALEAGDLEERAEPADLQESRGHGPKRVQVREAGTAQLRIGWPVPPRSHPDRLPLELLAILMSRPSGGEGLALAPFLGARAKVGVPGGRLENLFVIEAQPEEGHSLAESEQETQRAVLRLQQDSVPVAGFEGALRRMDLAALEAQVDAASLVRKLGMAWCQGGDWRIAFPDLRALRREGPAEVSRVARKYLRSDGATVGLGEPDLARDPGDAHQAELLRLLRAQALARLGDPLKAEALALQSMEQIRMLSLPQRERILQVLKPTPRRP